MTTPDSAFANEPLVDFADLDNIDAMKRALEAARAKFGQTHSLAFGAERISAKETLISHNPACHAEVIGAVAAASRDLAGRAVASAEIAFATWRRTPLEERVELLNAIASNLRMRKFEFAAWLVYEVSKNWNEAHLEVAQAIDFCEYYARQMQHWSTPVLSQSPGEHTAYSYVPLGAGVVLAPWNAPLSILCNLTLAPIVAGNTVVMKPSPRAPVIGALFFQLLQDSGVPAGVVNFVAGHDEEIGDALVDDSRVRFVAFTGSREIGLRIFARTTKHAAGQKHLKHAILEMGGKGTIIVDETADLDAAADSIAVSAFAFQGQKCSGCSRVVALSAIHDKLLQKLVERVGRLLVRDPASPNIALGAVIDERAYNKICDYFSLAKTEGLLATGGIAKKNTGYFVWPTIYTGVKPDSPLATEEIFGPVLTMLKARDWDDALRLANSSNASLSGGVFSQNEERLRQSSDELQAGNLYFNCKISDSAVGAHPAGGTKFSGNAFKSGGPAYLLNFLQEKTVVRTLNEGR